MAKIDVQSFTGMRPAISPRLLGESESQESLNSDTANGELTPIMASRFEQKFNFSIKSIWLHDATSSAKGYIWRCYQDRRSFVPSQITNDTFSRVFMSSDSGLSFVDADGIENKLGMTSPNSAPIFLSSEKRNGSVSFRQSDSTFSFTSLNRSERPYLVYGEKVTFTGTPPSPLAVSTIYRVLSSFNEEGVVRYSLCSTSSTEKISIYSNGTASCSVEYENSNQNRVYVFTAVNKYGDESAPSLPMSIACDASSNVKFNVLYTSESSESPAVKKRIYRTSTGKSGNTSYYFVDEIASSETVFTDNLLDEELAEQLPSLYWYVPPASLRNMKFIPGGVLVAHNDSEVMFSESYTPYAWPESRRYSVHGKIKNIAVSQNTVFVFTDSSVHTLTVEDPDSAYVSTLNGYAPCIGIDGVVPSPNGILFPCSDGLYLVSQGVSSATNITESLIGENEWRKLNPASFVAVYYDTTYLAFYTRENGDCGSLLLDFGDSGQARMRLMDEYGTAIQLVPGGRRIFYAKDIGNTGTSNLYEMFANKESPLVSIWKSKQFVFPTAINMGSVIVEMDTYTDIKSPESISFWGGCVGEHMAGEVPFGDEDSDYYPYGYPVSAVIRIFADQKLRASMFVRANTFMRIPQGYAARTWEFEITTLNSVKRVAIGTSIEELR